LQTTLPTVITILLIYVSFFLSFALCFGVLSTRTVSVSYLQEVIYKRLSFYKNLFRCLIYKRFWPL